MKKFFIELAILSSFTPVFGMEISFIAVQENTPVKQAQNNKTILPGANWAVQDAPDAPTMRPDSPKEVISDKEHRSSSSSNEGDTVGEVAATNETAEEKEIAAEMDRFLELAGKRQLWEQKYAGIMKIKLMEALRTIEQNDDLSEFIEKVQCFFTYGATPEWALLILNTAFEMCKSSGYTLLDVACLINRDARLDFWITDYHNKIRTEQGEDELIKIINSSHLLYTPLNCAVRGRSLATCILLIKLGADVCKGNSQGQTPIMIAASLGCLDILKALFENGAQRSIDIQDVFGKTALYYAVESDETEVAQKLITYGASLEAHNCKLESLLRMAIVRTNPKMVALLLLAGLNPNTLYWGSSPLVHAIEHYALGVSSSDLIWNYDEERQQKAWAVITTLMHDPRIDLSTSSEGGSTAYSIAARYNLHKLQMQLQKLSVLE